MLLHELIVAGVLRKATVALGHHLGLQLHLKLFAALPKALVSVLETSRALCVPVYMSVLS